MTRHHMALLMIRSAMLRGGRFMTDSSVGSTPIARAGPESVMRLIHKIWVASSGSTTPPSPVVSPSRAASTTPPNTVATSPMFELNRYRKNFRMLSKVARPCSTADTMVA